MSFRTGCFRLELEVHVQLGFGKRSNLCLLGDMLWCVYINVNTFAKVVALCRPFRVLFVMCICHFRYGIQARLSLGEGQGWGVDCDSAQSFSIVLRSSGHIRQVRPGLGPVPEP